MPFSQLGLLPELMDAITASNYAYPTPIQSQAIPPILEGKDLTGTAQTGTGKTAAFVLPILQRLGSHSKKIRALVLTPTRELAVQVETAVRKYGRFVELKSTTIYGGVSQQPQQQALRKGVDIVVATPGRLLDLMQQGVVNLSDVEILVLDEADRMLDMGFLPDIRRIVSHLPRERQTLLFSATLPPEIQELASSIQNRPLNIEIGVSRSPANGVTQHLYPVPVQLKSALLLHLLERETMSPVLVFTRTKHGADRLHHLLERHHFKVARIHSGRTQSQRQQALDGFRKAHFQILIATDIMARGIDVREISHVVNYDIPNNVDDYIHRVGRTGRAEKAGTAYTFVSPEEEIHVRSIEKSVRKSLHRVRLEDFDYQPSAKHPSRTLNDTGSKQDTALSRYALEGERATQVFDRSALGWRKSARKSSKGVDPSNFGGRREGTARSFAQSGRFSTPYREGSIGAPSEEERRELKRLQAKLFGPISPRSSHRVASFRNGGSSGKY